MDWTDALGPNGAVIEQMARDAMATLPEEFKLHALAVVLRVEDFAPDDILRDMEIEDPFQLTGLYDGIPLTQKSISDQPDRPDTIWLFRRPILDEWIERGNVTLSELVTHVLVHELAHHFGWSDDDIASIDKWWD
ncbi:MAG: metallopeptidase family protein [Paracoccaceae bacterium]|nr:metallopeptidase family protein [Paracoccaceae bacterium]